MPTSPHTTGPATTRHTPQPPLVPTAIRKAARNAGMRNIRPVESNTETVGYTALMPGGLYGALRTDGTAIQLAYMNRGAATMWLKRNTQPPAPAPTADSTPAYLWPAADRKRFTDEVEAAAADKPTHARYAARLLAHYSQGGTAADEPDGDDLPRLSQKAATALAHDIHCIYATPTGNTLVDNQHAYRALYRRMRNSDKIRHHRAVNRRQRWEETNPLPATLAL